MEKLDVLTAARQRIAKIFSEFEYVYVSFSGGKDSGVLLNLCLDHLRENEPLDRRMGVFHIDYEAQYDATTCCVSETFDSLPDNVDKYWCCLPLSVPCSTSMSQNNWIPWEKSKKSIWVRDMPEGVIHEDNHEFDFFRIGMEDYDFQKEFGAWLARKTGKKTACMIGVRSDESYDRRIMISSKYNKKKYPGVLWSTGGRSEDQFNFYPIYDWHVDDIWTYFGKTGYSYNKLYDLMYQSGMEPHAMRVASPFISQGIDSLKLYRTIEPHTWGKLVSRVNGVNFAGIYGGTTAMGWRSITKPKHFTWRQYRDFLLDTLPKEAAENYRQKFSKSENFWKSYGGALDDDTIDQIKKSGTDISVINKTARTDKKKTVRFGEYPDDLPEVCNFQAIPSYKRMCVCILKNDHLCKYMGFTMTKKEVERRRAAIEKYKDL